MRPFHIFFLVAILIYAAWAVWEIKQGKLTGRQRVGVLLGIGCFGLAWVANQFGW